MCACAELPPPDAGGVVGGASVAVPVESLSNRPEQWQ